MTKSATPQRQVSILSADIERSRSATSHKETVFVVDDGPATRESLRWLLEAVGLRVETYASPERFLERFDGSRPGCLLLDVNMPSMNGFEVQEELAGRGISTPIIFLTAYGSVPLAVKACQAGAVGFIEKPFGDKVLLQAVREALARDRLNRRQNTEGESSSQRVASLTAREREVMTRVVAGKTNKDIAQELDLSPRTVEAHRSRLMGKLGATSLADLVRVGLSSSATQGSDNHSPEPGASEITPAKRGARQLRLGKR